jgi:hypothetical protein
MAIGKETTRGTPVIPTVVVPLYEETLVTGLNLDLDNPIIGNRFARYNHFKGQRTHKGVLKVLAEPKTLPHLMNMILKKGTTTQSGSVYTHPYTLDNDTPAYASYTVEIAKGGVLHRYYGVEISKIAPVFEDNVMKLTLSVSALGQFSIAPITSAATTAVMLATDYDDAPNKGIVAGDTLVFVKVTGGTSDTFEEKVVASVNVNGTGLVVASLVGTYTTGDYCYIKQQSLTPTLGDPFKWSALQFCFGDTAAAALTAIQENIEKGSTFEIINEFEDENGAMRSGSLDPTALVRKQGDVTLTIKKSFKDYKEYERFLSLRKRALVIRAYGALISGSTKNEFRITINNVKVKESPTPLTTGEIIYLEQVLSGQYDTSDLQGMAVTIVNDVAGASYN